MVAQDSHLAAVEESHIVQFGQAYSFWHGYISLAVCVLSILANAANVVVLTRRKMWSPSNLLLTAIAFADILKMSSYCAFAVRFNIVSRVSEPQPFSWIVYLITHTHSVLVLHAITTWLTVTLANFRYFIICTKHGARKITTDVAKAMIVLCSVCSVIMYIPQYMAVGIKPYDDSDANGNATQRPASSATLDADSVVIGANQSETNSSSNSSVVVDAATDAEDASRQLYTYTDEDLVLYEMSHIIHGPVLKLLASVLITMPTVAVIIRMRKAAEKRAELMYRNSLSSCRVPVDSSDQSVVCSVPIKTDERDVPKSKSRKSFLGRLSVYEVCAPSARKANSASLRRSADEKYSTRSRRSANSERHHRTTLMLLAVSSIIPLEFAIPAFSSY